MTTEWASHLGLRREADVGESKLPLRQTDVNHHLTVVVNKRRRHEMPPQSSV